MAGKAKRNKPKPCRAGLFCDSIAEGMIVFVCRCLSDKRKKIISSAFSLRSELRVEDCGSAVNLLYPTGIKYVMLFAN